MSAKPRSAGRRAAVAAARDADLRPADTFLLLNEIAASLAVIERTCDRALVAFPVDTDAAVGRAIALEAARTAARATLEQIGDLAETLTAVLRLFAERNTRPGEPPLAVDKRNSSD